MNYQQTVDYLFSQLPMYQRTGTAAYKADLSNSHELDRYFNYPHRSYRTIHVAGTNGKGSVSHMLASVLQHAGYKTGLHTSPHLFDFRERIKVDGQMVPRSYVIDFVEKHRAFFEKIHPSFFEMSVFMAFEYFAETHVDIAIIEVGLGGRLDSTNVITPLLSVITNIGLDHTEFLGNTLESIAGEKAGIIKKNVPVVIGESHEKTKDVFVRTAGQNKAPVYFADNEYTIDYSLLSADGKFQTLNVRHENEITYPELQTDLLGIYQKKNIVTALTAIDALKRQGIDIPEQEVRNGLKSVIKTTGLMGRWQVVGYNPLTVLDNAHNAEGMTEVIKQIDNTAYRNLHFIFGMVREKSAENILKLLPVGATYYFTKASVPRALDEHILKDKSINYNLHGETYPNVGEAYKAACRKANPQDFIFIGGSTFVVADFLQYKKD